MRPTLIRLLADLRAQLRVPFVKVGLMVFGALVALYVLIQVRPSDVGATPSPTPSQPPPLPTVPELDAGPPAAPAPTTAQIVFNTVPPSKAFVTWGKKKLGKIEPNKPLIVVRPRDSGPLDVTVRAEGFLPVHTRAHTFSDNKVLVRLTAPEAINTLLGYRVPLDAGSPPLTLEETMFDGGAPLPPPPPPTTAPPPPGMPP
jgi:hypothetical protein